MHSPLDPPSLAEQAAEWMVMLTCEDPEERARGERGFKAWKAADPRHAQAAARVETFVAQVQGVRRASADNPRPARAALDAAYAAKRRRRRTALQAGGALSAVVAISCAIWLGNLASAPGLLQADIRSTQREWVEQTLSDGTRLTLSGASAVRLRYDPQRRTVELLGGDLRVDVAKEAGRPFYIETPSARIRALGTRFSVSYADGTTYLDMFESQVSVEPLAASSDGPARAAVVREGERVQVSRAGMGPVQALDAARVEEGWRHRQLILEDRPMPEVLAQLARHRPGGIQYDRDQLHALRVSGVLPLDRPDEALRLLQISFPELRLRSLASRWVWVDLQANQKKN